MFVKTRYLEDTIMAFYHKKSDFPDLIAPKAKVIPPTKTEMPPILSYTPTDNLSPTFTREGYLTRKTEGYFDLPPKIRESHMETALLFIWNTPDILECRTIRVFAEKFKLFLDGYQTKTSLKSLQRVTCDKVLWALSSASNALPRNWNKRKLPGTTIVYGFLSIKNKKTLGDDARITWLVTQNDLDLYIPPEFECFEDSYNGID